MNYFKKIFAVALIGISMPLCAKPIKVQCTDATLEYDDQTLKVLKSDAVDTELWRGGQNQYWNGTKYELKDNATIKLPIDSAGFTFMIFMTVKTDAQIFSFIDSLDEQSFRLISFYTQLLRERRISDLIKYKMFKDPKLQKLAEMPDDLIRNLINGNYQRWNSKLQRYENLAEKYLGVDIYNTAQPDSYQNYGNIYDSATADSVYAALVLIDFYQETLKKPLPLNTDHLKNIFNAQPYNIQQILLNKNLVTVS